MRHLALVAISWAACTDAPGSDAPSGPPILVIDRTVADFGDASIGAVTAKTVFVITNRGGSSATLRSELASDSSAFPVASDTCDGAAIAPGATCSVAFTFAPTRMGPVRAALTISAPGTSVGASLVGNGLAGAMLAISPTNQDLGAIVEGASSTPFSFVVTNTGGTPTGYLELHLAGNADFLVASDTCSHTTIAPNATCALGIVFAATASGIRAASIAITGAPGGTAKATLGGRGLAPSMLSITPASHDFLIADVGAPPLTSALVVTNTGDQATGALVTSYLGPTDLGIVNDGCTTHSLDANESCTITTRFAPLAWGQKHATLQIAPAVGSIVTASLAGTGRDSVPLAVAIEGAGAVSATGAPTTSGRMIDCPHGSCAEAYQRTLAAPIVTLVAHPDPGYHFDHWTGESCFQGATCAVTLATPAQVTATFAINAVPLAITVAGSGSVTSSISAVAACAGSCTTALPIGTQLTLTAHPSGATSVARWTGACSGNGPTCTLTVSGPTTVGLAFTDCTGELQADASTLSLWHLNDGGGQIVHDAASHYDGTLGKDDKVADDDPVWTTGRFGGGLYFDASNCPPMSDDHCEWMHVLTSPLAFPAGFTLELWIEPTGILGSSTIDFDAGSGPRFANIFSTETNATWMSMTDGDQLSWVPPGGAESFANVPLANAWHAVAVTYDGLVSRIYVDGLLAGQAPGTFASSAVTNFDLGGIPFGAFLNGYMDEIRISNIARTPVEIANAYAVANVCP